MIDNSAWKILVSDPQVHAFDVQQLWVNICEAGNLRRYRAHYDVIVIICPSHHMHQMKAGVIVMPTLSRLMEPKFVITTSGASSGDKVGIMETLGFH